MVKENGMVMMTERELERMEHEKEQLYKECHRRIELLQQAITDLLHKADHGPHDVRVSKTDFLQMYQKALDYMWEQEEKSEDPCDGSNDIYGKNFTVHWNGIYCDCGDGAAPSNYIIPAIEGIDDEDPTEY